MAGEPEIIEEDEPLAPSSPEETTVFAQKLSALKNRCEQAKIGYEHTEADEIGQSYATISLPAGRSDRAITIYNEARAEALLGIEFEKFRFLSEYEAICNYKDGFIEAGLRTTRMPSHFMIQRLLGLPVSSTSESGSIEITPPGSLPGRPILELGPCSIEFQALCGARAIRTSLKLKGARASQHDQALAELRSYADSLFFQIDSMLGSAFILERQRRVRLVPPARRRVGLSLVYPSAHYNKEAMSLYWYAKSARDMPLLRFLAFYQSIEFYFPRYSQMEARKRVSSILKQPTFRPHRDDDIDRLISAIQSARGTSIGSERSQMRAVINECISAEDLRQYLTATKQREEHFSGKAPKYHKVPLANKNADLRNDVADRIYDIRCKIVHTKNEHSDDDIPMILPFSEDAEYLLHDIDLAEFIARSVLASSSGELN